MEKHKQSSALQQKLTTNGKPKPANKDLVFGKEFSDHMLEVHWTREKGWGAPLISPYHKLELDPACNVLHYSLECFEGMKAYRDKNNKIRLFRPDKNMDRLLRSSQRLALPSFDKDELLNCIKSLLKVDKEWIPNEKGYSLYIRPTCIGTQASLGVGPSNSAMIFVICSPVGPYYKTGFNPVKLLADTRYARAWPGGTGDAKVGANYAPTIVPQLDAMKHGCSQVLWLFGDNHQVTEVGTMNLFMFWKNEAGENELITAPLDGTILHGVTRASILELARSWGEFKVTEKPFTMSQIEAAAREKRIYEMFGAGTAAIVSPVSGISYQGRDINIPLELGNSGKLTKRFMDTILGIQYGEIPSDWSVVVD